MNCIPNPFVKKLWTAERQQKITSHKHLANQATELKTEFKIHS